jgi:hypothetical protein
MLPFLRYKEKESDLQRAFGLVPVTVEAVTGSDHYYTDGDSTKSAFKVVIDSVKTIYVPQFIYNVDRNHGQIIMEWMKNVEKVE